MNKKKKHITIKQICSVFLVMFILLGAATPNKISAEETTPAEETPTENEQTTETKEVATEDSGKANVQEVAPEETDTSAVELQRERGPQTRAGVGFTFAQTFPDPAMAEAVRNWVNTNNVPVGTAPSVNTTITASHINNSSTLFSIALNVGVTDIEGIQHFNKITQITVQNNPLISVTPNIGLMTQLTHINLAGSPASTLNALPASLNNLTNLNYLAIFRFSNLDDTGIPSLNNLTQLSTFYFVENKLSKVPVYVFTGAGNPANEYLSFWNNAITDLPAADYNYVKNANVNNDRKGFRGQKVDKSEGQTLINQNFTFPAYPIYTQVPTYGDGSAITYKLTKPNMVVTTITPTLSGGNLTIPAAQLTQYGNYTLVAEVTSGQLSGIPSGGGAAQNSKYTHTFNIVETISHTKQFQSEIGVTLQADETVERSVGTNFTDAAPAITNYVYQGYKLNGGALVAGTPNIPTLTGQAAKTITYIYRGVAQAIDVNYETRTGGAVTGKTNFSTTANFGTVYTPTPAELAATNYVLVDWKLNGVSQGNTTPSTTIAGATNITLVYGQDNDNNGVEDITITKKYETGSGTMLAPTTSVSVDVGTSFTDGPSIVVGYTYQGFKVDGGALQAGNPNIAVVVNDSNKTITYIYAATAYTVDVNYETRAGGSVVGKTNFQTSADFGTTYAPTAGQVAATNYVLVDWKLGAMAQGNTTPSTLMPANNIILTLVYGQDKGGNGGVTPDGIEDITITKKFETAAGTTLQASTEVFTNVGSSFTDGPAILVGYTYSGYKVDGGALQVGNPNLAVVAGDSNKTVTYIYAVNAYMVDVNYETRTGGSVTGKTDFQTTANFGSTYAPTAGQVTATNYVLVDWKLDGVSQGNTTPTTVMPANSINVTLVYAQDDDNDGIEDITFTKKFETAAGATLSATTTKIVNVGSNFTDGPTLINGYTYSGYKVDGGALQVGNPNLAVVAADPNKTVTYIYAATGFTIDVTYETRTGAVVSGKASFQASQAFGSIYAPTALELVATNYVLVDWKLNGVNQGNTTPSTLMPASNINMTLVYAQDDDNDGIEDITFTKKFETAAGATLQATTTKVVNVGTSFTDGPNIVIGYTYQGYKVNGGATLAGNPNIAVVAGDNNQTITYIYAATAYTVDVIYETRTGAMVAGKADFQTSASFGSTYAPTALELSAVNYVLVDWKLNGVSQGNTAPTTVMPSSNINMTLVYAQDDDNDGIEDITITKKFETGAGVTLSATTTSIVNVGTTFSDGPTVITGYTYQGYKVNGGATQVGNPSIAVVAADTNKTVTYIYAATAYQVNVNYETRTGGSVTGKVDFQTTANFGATYAPTAGQITATNYVLVDWKLDGVSQGNATPSAVMPANSINVTLVYAQDDDNDGIEDITITKHYETLAGAMLAPTTTSIINVGTTFNDGPAVLVGYTYQGFRIDGGAVQLGTPSIAVAAGDANKSVTYVYNATAYQVDLDFETRLGGAVPGKVSIVTSKNYQETYAPTALEMAAPAGYVLVDWKLNGVSQGNTTPSAVMPANNIQVTLVYGQDDDGDGIEDITFTKEFEDGTGAVLQASSSVVVNVGSNFTDAPDILAGYTYSGYKVNGGALQVGTPNISVVAGDSNKTVTYVYAVRSLLVDVTYELRDGSNVPTTTNFQRTANFGATYAPTPAELVVTNYILVDWKLDGVSQGNTTPSTLIPANNVTMSLVYGQDGDGDGIEDITFTKEFEDRSGNVLQASSNVFVNVGSIFNDAPDALTNYVYVGYKVNGGFLQVGTPSIAVASGDATTTVTYVYGQDLGGNGGVTPDGIEDITITKEFKDRAGATLQPDELVYVNVGDTFADIDPVITDHVYVGNQVDGSPLVVGLPSILVVAGDANAVVTYVYGQDLGGNGGITPDGTEDITLTEEFEDESGVVLQASETNYVNIGDSFTDPAAMIAGYTYVGYKINGGILQTGTPNITIGVQDTHTLVTYLYKDEIIRESKPSIAPPKEAAPVSVVGSHPSTGDHTNTGFMAMLMAVSGGLFVLLKKRKKEENEDTVS